MEVFGRQILVCTYRPATQEETVATGPHGNTRQQSQPIWVSAFLDRATDVTPTAENTAATPSPDLPLRALR